MIFVSVPHMLTTLNLKRHVSDKGHFGSLLYSCKRIYTIVGIFIKIRLIHW